MEALVPVLLHLEARDRDRQRQHADIGQLAAGGGKPARHDDEQVGRRKNVGHAHRMRRAHGHAPRHAGGRERLIDGLLLKSVAAAARLIDELRRVEEGLHLQFVGDGRMAALHLSLDSEAIAAMYGQHKLGLEPVGVY